MTPQQALSIVAQAADLAPLPGAQYRMVQEALHTLAGLLPAEETAEEPERGLAVA